MAAAVMWLGANAHADGMPLPNGGDLQFNRFFIIDENGAPKEPGNADDTRFYLNYAHCACGKADAGLEKTFEYEITLTGTTTANRPAEVWVGTDCNNDAVRAMQCRQLDMQTIADISVLATSPARVKLRLYDLLNVTAADMMMPDCRKEELAAKLWLLVDADGNGSREYWKTVDVAQTTNMTGPIGEVKSVDTKAPPLPTGFNASSGEEAIVISWTAPTSRADDIHVYQALCIDEEGLPVASKRALYQTTDLLCGRPQGIMLTETSLSDVDGTPLTEVPEPFKTLDTRFVCGEATKTATSLTIGEVDNGKPYKIALLVIDRYGNVDGVYFNRTIVPKPVTDLWEDLHDRNSGVDGGCLLSQTYGEGNPLTRVLREFRDTTLARSAFGRGLTSAYYATLGKLSVEGSVVLRVIAALYLLPLVLVALLWHTLTLPGMLALFVLVALRRRIRRVALAIALLVPSLAAADDFEPYWDTSESEDASLIDFPDVKWHVGIRVGPYIPEIDLQAGLNAATGLGPYEAMFGDYYLRDSSGVLKKTNRAVWQVLPMLDVDRVLWDRFGQVTVGGSLGYMQKSAYAYLDGTTEHQPMRERSKTSRNTFRLIPLAATVGYRFTYFDDMYGIPVVPYVRGGLSYYMWQMKAPNGSTSKFCEEMSATGSCVKEDKAYGASFGFQGSIGLAVRAERIDSDAATSMRSSGLMHAGFYAEYQYAKVDGFGSDSKLSVGDNTWFAGVDFEF
ncbi:MAG: MXAN_2562 family outer membrane beta-barrel protein [Myxococcota bacterium]|nr:MXAN_2562 family outer membrane beta-barrel protein [Myxococcota bacterium]